MPLATIFGTAAVTSFEARERREHRRGVRGPRIEPHDRLGHERERALGADDELREVVAGGRLHELAAGADDLAGSEHRFETEHLMARHAVLHRAHAARVGRDVAAEARRALAREHRIHETVRPRRLVELVERHARLHHGDVVLEIDLDDLVHAFERHDDAAVGRDARAREPGARTACGERNAGVGGELDDSRRPRRWFPGFTTASGRCAVAVSASSWV